MNDALLTTFRGSINERKAFLFTSKLFTDKAFAFLPGFSVTDLYYNLGARGSFFLSRAAVETEKRKRRTSGYGIGSPSSRH